MKKLNKKAKKVALATVWIEPQHELAIVKYARKCGWVLNKFMPGQEKRLCEFKADGIISQLRSVAGDFCNTVQAMDCPIIELSHYFGDWSVPRIRQDRENISEIAVEHLCSRNFKNLCYMGFKEDRDDLHGYLTGFRKGVAYPSLKTFEIFFNEEKNTPSFPTNIFEQKYLSDTTMADYHKWFKLNITNMEIPLGIFCWDIVQALNVIEGCLKVGLLIPEQVAVVSMVSNTIETEFSTIPITAVVPDYEIQAHKACALLDWRMRGHRCNNITHYSKMAKLIVNESSDIYAVDHLDSAQVIRFVIKNLANPNLSVQNLIKNTGVSQWKIYNVVQKYLGSTVAEFIEFERIKKAKNMMLKTSLSLTLIAEKCGFSELRHFRRTMLRLEKITPSMFRKINRPLCKLI